MHTNRSGFIKLILVIVAIILILSYFGVRLRPIVNSEAGRDNFNYLEEIGLRIWHWIAAIWEQYVRPPVMLVWNRYLGPNLAKINLTK